MSVKENLNRLLQERKAYWDKEGAPLAQIAETRAFNDDEAEHFESVAAQFDAMTQRIAPLRRALEHEQAMEPFADILGDPNHRSGDAREGREPRWIDVDSNSGDNIALRSNQRFADHPTVRQATNAATEASSASYENVGEMVRALSTGAGGGSAIVPEGWASQIIDLAREQASVTQAGATVIPMDRKTVHVGRVTSDPISTFRAEGTPITASDPGFDAVVLEAKTQSVLTVVSMEWVQDVENGSQLVIDSIAKSIAQKIDQVALYGGITSGSGDINLPSPLNPRGVLAALTAVRPGNVLGNETNGTVPPSAAYWGEIIDLLYTVRDGNEEPTAMIWNTKLARQYAKIVDSTGQPLNLPADVAAINRISSNQIPSYTRGTMEDRATDVFAGDWSQLLIGQRLGLTIQVLTERYAENGQVGIAAHWRGDIQPARPGAFAVYRALQGAA